MTALITLSEAKFHCRIDHGDEDTLIAGLIATATTATGDYLNAATALDSTAAAPVKAAALLLVADLYENRESQSDRQLYQNDAYHRLLAPYRVMSL